MLTEKQKDKLCKPAWVERIFFCSTCQKEHSVWFYGLFNERDEHGDVQIMLIPKMLAGDRVWVICDCKTLNEFYFTP